MNTAKATSSPIPPTNGNWSKSVYPLMPANGTSGNGRLLDYNTITLCFGCFSISSEILIDFGLTLFMVLTGSDDNRENEVPSLFQKACNLIIENRKHRQSDKA